MEGRYHPNERLVEATVAAELGAGRSAIRSALVRLDQEGLVVLEPNRGARVRHIDDSEALEIEEIRATLEVMLAGRAAARAGEDDLAALWSLIEQMRARVEAGDSVGYSELNAPFHQRIWAAAEQPTAARLLGGLKSQGIRFQYQTILRPGRTERSLREHEAIYEAMRLHDPELAEAAMREHLQEVVETLRWAMDGQRRASGWLPA